MSTDHRTKVEPDRYRVVCLSCPWFHYGFLTEKQLKAVGKKHVDAVKGRPDADD